MLGETEKPYEPLPDRHRSIVHWEPTSVLPHTMSAKAVKMGELISPAEIRRPLRLSYSFWGERTMWADLRG
jgi:hypothetical protein